MWVGIAFLFTLATCSVTAYLLGKVQGRLRVADEISLATPRLPNRRDVGSEEWGYWAGMKQAEIIALNRPQAVRKRSEFSASRTSSQ